MNALDALIIVRFLTGDNRCYSRSMSRLSILNSTNGWMIDSWFLRIVPQLDITIHVITSQLSGHCDVISNRLWRHQQIENQTSEMRGRYVNIIFIVIYGFYALTWVLFWCFPRCFATREINIKITLSWALKQFVTQVHTLFSIHCSAIIAPTIFSDKALHSSFHLQLILVMFWIFLLTIQSENGNLYLLQGCTKWRTRRTSAPQAEPDDPIDCQISIFKWNFFKPILP